MKSKKPSISQDFQRGLLVLVVVAFLATTAFLWLFQTRLAVGNAVSLLELNIADVHQDITDASDENLLNLTSQIAEDLNGTEEITNDLLFSMVESYEVTEINYVNQEGIIKATTFPEFMDYNMASGTQSAEFMVLLSGEESYVQNYQPVSYDASISRKYGGFIREDG